VRAQVLSCRDPTSLTGFDIEKLSQIPLLQSIWAETMRLRVHIFNTRNTQNQEVNVNNWLIPRNSTIFLTSTLAHMDPAEWNTGEHNEHPLDTFWAERFIEYRNDTVSELELDGKPGYRFDASMAGSWIPFGGGPYKCPGRHFAKREALMLCALLVSHYDVEFDGCCDDVGMDWRTCGLGTLKPDRKIKYRMRRRLV
jgi:cytochrome P450